jgi:hypothetical protein
VSRRSTATAGSLLQPLFSGAMELNRGSRVVILATSWSDPPSPLPPGPLQHDSSPGQRPGLFFSAVAANRSPRAPYARGAPTSVASRTMLLDGRLRMRCVPPYSRRTLGRLCLLRGRVQGGRGRPVARLSCAGKGWRSPSSKPPPRRADAVGAFFSSSLPLKARRRPAVHRRGFGQRPTDAAHGQTACGGVPALLLNAARPTDVPACLAAAIARVIRLPTGVVFPSYS